MTSSPPTKKRRVADLLCSGRSEIVIDETASALRADGSWAAAEAITKQMPSGSIPLTILTGFLGAGKSTVLNYILGAKHGLRIAVLINEFGAVDIDNQLVDTKAEGAEGDPVQLNNGCVCCTISNGFIDAVQRILEKPGEAPHYFILETSGVADPKPIIDSVANTELRRDMYVDQVLTVVDSSSWTAEHYDSETAIKQLQFADTVLLSKTDLVDKKKLSEVVETLEDIKPHVRILKSQKGYVPLHALFDLDLARRGVVENKMAVVEGKTTTDINTATAAGDAKDGETKSKPEDHHNHHKHHEHHGENGAHSCGHKHAEGEKCGETKEQEEKKKNHLEEEGFSSISFTSSKSFSLSRFRQDFMEELPAGVFRAKGLLWFRNYPSRFVFHWSGSRFNVEEDEWGEGVDPNNQLVVIGRKLDKALITEMLENCLTRDSDPDDEDDFDDEEEEEDEMMMYEEGMQGIPPEQLQAPIPGIGPELMPQLAALNNNTAGPVLLPRISTMQGANEVKLAPLPSLAAAEGSTVPASSVAEPAVEETPALMEQRDGTQ